MKTFWLIVLLLVLTLHPVVAQNKIFDKYADMEDVEYVCITKAMLEVLNRGGKASFSGIEIKGVFSSLEGILFIFSHSEKVYSEMLKDYRAIEKDKDCEVLMHHRIPSHSSTSISFCQKEHGNEVVVLVQDMKDKESTFVVLYGTFTKQELRDMLNF